MAWFGRSKLSLEMADLRHELAELREGAHRHDRRLMDLDTHLNELADALTRTGAAVETLNGLVSTATERLASIEEARKSDHGALEKTRLSLVRLELELRRDAEETEKMVAALLDRIETYRVNMKTA